MPQPDPPEEDPCFVAEGDGCGQDRPAPEHCTADSGEEAPAPEVLTGEVEGGGCGCVQGVPRPGGLLLGLLVLALALRRRVGLLLLLLVLISGPARAFDAQLLRTDDGGRFVALAEGDPGAAWTSRFALSTTFARNPAVIRLGGILEEPLLDRLWSHRAGFSQGLGRILRVGGSLVLHSAEYQEEPTGILWGDPSLWVSVPLRGADARTQHSWTVSIVPGGARAQDYLLGDAGVVRAAWAVERGGESLAWGINLGLSLRTPTELPGVVLSHQAHLGLGLDWSFLPRAAFTPELTGALPINGTRSRSGTPIEALGSFRIALTEELGLRLGGGPGLSRGVGSTRWRLLAMVQSMGEEPGDRDGDGIVNPRDLCDRAPEDHDGFRDLDGCPDRDDDKDGILDPEDGCRLEPERVNGYRDLDGCPDLAATVTVRVRSSHPDPPGRAQVRRGEESHLVLLGEATQILVPGGVWTLVAEAEAHRPQERTVVIRDERPRELVFDLVPMALGWLQLRAVDDKGQPLAAIAAWETHMAPVPEDGLEIEHDEGLVPMKVWAPGYHGVDIQPAVVAGQHLPVEVVLRQKALAVVDGQVELEDDPRFPLNEAVLDEEARRRLGRLAAWLKENPSVELLRVEGHADGSGDPRYNLELSQARAEAVGAVLVELGVSPTRLELLASGEAYARGDEAETDRHVTFRLLIWDRETLLEPPVEIPGAPPP